MTPLYVVDTNFFIQAHRINYPIDIAVSFWTKIRELALEGRIISIDKVLQELKRNEDLLTNWCSDNLPAGFFRDSSNCFTEYSEIIQWAFAQNKFSNSALKEFAESKNADAFLIAYALQNKDIRVVVSHETSQPMRTNRIKIPDVCIAFEIRCIFPMEMFKELAITF